MMVRQLLKGEQTYEVAGEQTKVVEAVQGDYELFDGQQRMAAILLGFGLGPLSKTHRLWFGLREDGKAERAQFRITTTGQPFGYRISEPNAKLEADQQRKAFWKYVEEFLKSDWKESTPAQLAAFYQDAFKRVPANYLAGDHNWQWFEVSNILSARVDRSDRPRLDDILERKVAFKVLTHTFQVGEYEEFFRRPGQGGVALSQDELTYSIIKKTFPQARPAFEDAASDSGIGALASPTDLALGSLRLIRIEHADPKSKEWERVGRPTADWVSALPSQAGSNAEKGENKGEPIVKEFRKLLNQSDGGKRTIVNLLHSVRTMLAATGDDNPHQANGLPNILLARLPHLSSTSL